MAKTKIEPKFYFNENDYLTQVQPEMDDISDKDKKTRQKSSKRVKRGKNGRDTK